MPAVPTPDKEARPARRARTPLSEAQVVCVVRHIEETFTERLLLSDLAGLVHMSAGHFCRRFKATFDESFSAYLRRRRVTYAMELMVRGDDSLGYIALACGMADQAYFSRVFLRVTGETPGRWRRQHRR